MKSFEEAKKIALSKNKTYDTCAEYDKAYVFSSKKATNDVGGPNAPIAVMKDSGNVKTFSRFISDDHPNPKSKKVSMGNTVKKPVAKKK